MPDRSPRPHAAGPPAQKPLLGMANMMASGFLNQVMNGAIRTTAASGIHPFEIAFLRVLFGSLFLSGMVARSGLSVLHTAQPWLHVIRAVLNAASMLSFFLALTIEPLAKLSALMFSAPLFAAVGAALFLRERMGPGRLGGLLVGFSGALIVMRPGIEEMTLGLWLTVVAAATWGAALVLIKHQSRTESSLTIAIYAAFLLLPFNLAAALFVWVWPTWEMLAWCAGIGFLGTAGQIALGNAFRHADATVVLPFDFTKLIWAAGVGYVWFGEVPDLWTWVGGTVIFGATLFLAYRERTARGAPVPAE
jgi:drug/metabolite transporter (DMT)-like permease